MTKKCKCVCPWCTVKPKKHKNCNWNCRLKLKGKKTTPSELFEGNNSSLRKTYEKAVTPTEPTGWDKSCELGGSIIDFEGEFRPDAKEVIRVFILEEKSKSYEEGQRDEREVIIGEEDIKKKYMELIYAVAHKYSGEIRHETALRYILNAEKGGDDVSSTAIDIIKNRRNK